MEARLRGPLDDELKQNIDCEAEPVTTGSSNHRKRWDDSK